MHKMIQIRQDEYSVKSLDQLIGKNTSTILDIDINSIKKDIDTLSKKLNSPLSKFDKINIQSTIEYLNKLIKKVKNGKIELVWGLDDYILKSYPIEFRHIPEYNVEMADYIVTENKSMIRVAYPELLDIIALEVMYRDLGETFQSMEAKLKDIGITSIVNCNQLLRYFEDGAYILSKSLRVGDSPYCSFDGRAISEYFGRKEFKTGRYRECIEYSVQHALVLILGKLTEKLTLNNINYKICSISDSGIYIMSEDKVQYDTNKIENVLKEDVVIRAFGRQFLVNPVIDIF